MEIEDIDEQLDLYFTIKHLLDEGAITKEEIQLFEFYLAGFSSREIAKICNKGRNQTRIIISNVSSLIKRTYENEILCSM